MSDLTERLKRLRNEGNYQDHKAQAVTARMLGDRNTLSEAITELERLKRERDEAASDAAEWQYEAEKAEAERDRLRVAAITLFPGYPDKGMWTTLRMASLLAALADPKEESDE